MGIIGSIKVIIGLERCIKPKLVQLGNQKWVMVIQSICTIGYAIPPFIIYKGRVYILAQYKEANILYNQKLLVFKNGWINNKLKVIQLKHFNVYIKTRQVRGYQLLILNGYKSYQSQEFKDYYLKHKVFTLYIPAYLLHILQPLDVVCFLPLKLKYS